MGEKPLCLRELLRNLPSQGYFTAAEIVAKPLMPYLCKHDAQPPADQVIRNEPEMPVLRSKRVEGSLEEEEKPKAGKSGLKRKVSAASAKRGRKKSKATPA